MPSFAAVDVGSNAVRLLMVRLSPLGALVDAKFHRYALRLGTDVFAHGAVGKVCARQLVQVFR
ncbi:MAG: Ppx/GppA family phosphatase, partial [Deltaproteobacteria bacterium]|nr:Ppx/GppA family phosphatase [Deltaproteobacteria bacterium]